MKCNKYHIVIKKALCALLVCFVAFVAFVTLFCSPASVFAEESDSAVSAWVAVTGGTYRVSGWKFGQNINLYYYSDKCKFDTGLTLSLGSYIQVNNGEFEIVWKSANDSSSSFLGAWGAKIKMDEFERINYIGFDSSTKFKTNMPIYYKDLNKWEWLGVIYDTKEDLAVAFGSADLFDVSNNYMGELDALEYSAPLLNSVKVEKSLLNPISSINFLMKEYDNSSASAPATGGGVFTVSGIDINGNQKIFEFDVSNDTEGFLNLMPPLAYYGFNDSEIVEGPDNIRTEIVEPVFRFDYPKFIEDIAEKGINDFTVKSVKLDCYYIYKNNVKSKTATYTYDITTSSVTGTTYDPIEGDLNVSKVVDYNGTGNQINVDEKKSFQSVIDWFVNTFNSAVVAINTVFSSIIAFVSNSMAFIRHLGSIFQIIFGSSLGTLIEMCLLFVVVFRVFGR